MRCKFCGWNNPDHVSACQKCGNPTGVVESTPIYEQGGGDDDDKKTVVIKRGSGAASRIEKRRCPNCSYPVLKGMTVCPQCKYELGLGDFQMPEQNASQPEPTPVLPKGEADVDKKTINPYFNKKKPDPVMGKFSLTPIKREDEEVGPAVVEFTGDNILLNRHNVEPDNNSITGKMQAVMTFENGNWCIQDQSEQRTTFVRAAQKTLIQDGDIILLGNRMLVFHESK